MLHGGSSASEEAGGGGGSGTDGALDDVEKAAAAARAARAGDDGEEEGGHAWEALWLGGVGCLSLSLEPCPPISSTLAKGFEWANLAKWCQSRSWGMGHPHKNMKIDRAS